MTAVRFLLLLQRRLVGRDRAVLTAFGLLALVALVCASAGPQLLTAELDAATRHALAADPGTDVVVRTGVGNAGRASGRFLVSPDQVGARAEALRSQLPDALRAATLPPTAGVVGPDQRLTAADTRPALQNGPVGVSIGLIPDPRAIRLRSGALPGAAVPGVVDVVLSQADADASSLRVGSTADLPPSTDLLPGERLRIRVVGVVDRAPVAGPSPWADLGPVWEPRRNRNGTAAPLQIVVLTDAAGIGSATDALGPFPAVLRLRLPAERLTTAEAHVVARQVGALRANPDPLVVSGQEALRVVSSLPEAVAQAEQEARSARAQFLLLTAGVLGTAAVALVLLAGLVAARRRDVVDLQRARGAAVPAVAAPALLESAALVLLAATVAALVTRTVGSPGTAVIAAVALLATPVALAGLAARGAVRRAPANRADRARLRRLRRTRRAAVEAGLIAIAVVALLVLDAGGGLSGSAPNPLLLVAPLLLAAATTLVVLRLVPPALRGVALLARRSRGVAGVLVSARAGRRGAALPVLALCLATGLALNDGMLLASVVAGQEAAAWERVGADARTTAPVDLDRVRAQPGVRAAAAVVEVRGTSVDLATTSTTATLLAVDAGYPAVVAGVPGAADAPVLRRLDDAAVLPVVVDRALAGLMVGRTLRLRLDSGTVAARAVGVLPEDLPGVAPGQTVVADLAALRSRGLDAATSRTLAVGPGAGAALAAASAPGATVTTRSGWLAAKRAAPLVAGTRQATLLAAGALALLAAVALSAAALAGAAERRRTLALLRTLGLPRRAGWWLLLADLLPLVLGGVAGGAVVGVVAAAVFDPALSLTALTGGRADPPVVLSGGVVALVLTGLLVVLGATVGVERLTWRRDRFDEVLRAGGRG